jgi:hypothetical protein
VSLDYSLRREIRCQRRDSCQEEGEIIDRLDTDYRIMAICRIWTGFGVRCCYVSCLRCWDVFRDVWESAVCAEGHQTCCRVSGLPASRNQNAIGKLVSADLVNKEEVWTCSEDRRYVYGTFSGKHLGKGKLWDVGVTTICRKPSTLKSFAFPRGIISFVRCTRGALLPCVSLT